MPYKQYEKVIDGQKRYCIKNLRTGNVTCFYSPESRATGIRMREMYAHNFVPGYNRTSKKGKRHRVKSHRRRS